MQPTQPTIVWFRNDLRLADNPALHATQSEGEVICLYVLEEGVEGQRQLGGAAKWWLHQSLTSLAESVSKIGGKLILRRGDPREILSRLADETGAGRVVWNRRYGQPERDLDSEIKSDLKARQIDVQSYNGSLLTEPWTIETKSGGYYRVYTPYWKSVRACYSAGPGLRAPDELGGSNVDTEELRDWQLEPSSPNWASEFSGSWQPGESGAAARLEAFLDEPINCYDEHRNRPDLDMSTSGLSPHLKWGEIGPAQIWREVVRRLEDGRYNMNEDAAWTFLSELVWREFSYVLLFHNPDLADTNYNGDFAHMPWRDSTADYKAWCRGQTGYPIVDAGMRQLWITGWMHNRVRMITASFLTKHLLLPWQMGEDWFWDTLVDADPASNAASWQWVAGSGADAAPYFRVFNPITQGEKFDETGDYVRHWCPELAKLPTKYLFSPWTAPDAVLKKAGITLGETYPLPIVDHKAGRERALAAYNTLKERRSAA